MLPEWYSPAVREGADGYKNPDIYPFPYDSDGVTSLFYHLHRNISFISIPVFV
ncbi:hypothetical protein FORC41_0804 [Escherichia coli]|nr:hypothetical protein FORC41_0804 [Escherichia coli]ASO84809.1 hypothetical protein AKN41_3211 [Escherichia coli]EGW81512.1 hypothetical protein ECSTEC94C_3522 [Escherichia coli STEC_94C]